MYYVGMDIHKKVVAVCVKTKDGEKIQQKMIKATRKDLADWMRTIPGTWRAAMEATLFTAWVYDFIYPHAEEVLVAHPEMLKAITAAKKKNDMDDAEKICDLLRVDLLPECYFFPKELRDLRRALRYRNYTVRLAVSTKNKISGLLMEVGAEYDKSRLHGKRYFESLLESLDYIPPNVIEMLKFSRESLTMFSTVQKQLVSALRDNDLIRERVQRLMTIPGVGEITALTWALEIGDPHRFGRVRNAVSYCGLVSAQNESAGKQRRGPISKKRNKHLQTILIEASKLAPNWNQELAEAYHRELQRGNRNRATLAVARKLVAYLLAVDKSGKAYVPGMKNAA